MTIILLLLTLLSLAAAAVFAAAAWRARTETARRSAARVAALASALGSEPGSLIWDPGSGIGDPERGDSRFDHIPDPESRITGPGSRVPVSPMFASATADRRALTKPAIATAIGAILLIGGGTMLRNAGEAADQAAAAHDGRAVLELVSMRHVRDARTLTVTGLVRNPPAGVPVSDVAALVFAFDRTGEFVASGQGALQLAVLQPGEEAPFAVTVPDVADVGRYRVSFRTPAGPLRHVDRRAARQIARTQ
jgi:hypothetical protein